jgi:dTDP-4-amino-4,6-dideoxygalactose transaminase
MNIPFTDLKREYKKYKRKYNEAFAKVLSNSNFVLGDEVSNFEREFSNFIGSKYTVTVNSGLDALVLSIQALGLSPGDEILLPANTFIATIIAISQNGCQPVLVPNDEYYNIDPERIGHYISDKTKAIIVVHLYGHAARMDYIMYYVKKHNLFLIEDCAQSHGASFDGQNTGTWGDVGCFSFYPTKTLGGFGDGGAITTDSEVLYHNLRKLRNYGSSVKYHHDIIGFNTRLDEIQAALLRVKLDHIQKVIENRRIIASKYLKEINNEKIVLPLIAHKSTHVWHLFVVQTDNREDFRTHLKNNGIETGIHYPIPIHLSDAYKNQLVYVDNGELAMLSGKIVSLPLYDWMTLKEATYVIKIINSY